MDNRIVDQYGFFVLYCGEETLPEWILRAAADPASE